MTDPTQGEPQGGPWTQHGHVIPGVTVDGPGRPPIARCGGVGMCGYCSAEAARLQANVTPQPAQASEHVGVEARGVLWMALRYALGRQTYAVQEVAHAIAQHAHQLDEWQRERMAQEIERELGYAPNDAAWGHDAPTWRRAIADLRAPQPAGQTPKPRKP